MRTSDNTAKVRETEQYLKPLSNDVEVFHEKSTSGIISWMVVMPDELTKREIEEHPNVGRIIALDPITKRIHVETRDNYKIYTAVFKEAIPVANKDEIDAGVEDIKKLDLEKDRFITKVPLPDDTIYGLGGLTLDDNGVERVKAHGRIKGTFRRRGKPTTAIPDF